MGPCLDKTLSYITYVGDWKHLIAYDIIKCKRTDDTLFYTYRPFFSEAFGRAYGAFMDASFQTYNGFGEDALIKTATDGRDQADLKRLAPHQYNPQAVHDAYTAMLQAAASDFDLTFTPAPYRPSNQAPAIKNALN